MAILTVTSHAHTSDGYFVDLINDKEEVITIHPFNQSEFDKYTTGSTHEIDLEADGNLFTVSSFEQSAGKEEKFIPETANDSDSEGQKASNKKKNNKN